MKKSRRKKKTPPIDKNLIFDYISKEFAINTKSWRSIGLAAKSIGCSYEAYEKWSCVGKYENNQKQVESYWNWIPENNFGLKTLLKYASLSSEDFDPHIFDGVQRVALKPGKRRKLKRKYVEPKQPWTIGPDVFQNIIKGYIDIATEEGLMAMSPVAIDPNAGTRQTVVDLLAELYQPDDKLYIGEAMPPSGCYSWEAFRDPAEKEKCKLDYQRQHIKTAAEWIQYFACYDHLTPQHFSHIRPNPLSGEISTTTDGKQSLVSDNCVAKFKYAVVEFDDKTIEEQIAFWLYMINHKMDIAALIHSGGKSIHGWLAVDCKDQEEWTKDVERHLFDQILHPLGADRACKNESRLSRLPGVSYLENNQIRNQRLLYLDPKFNIKEKR